MTCPQISKSTCPSKISSHNSWNTDLLSKVLCNNASLNIQRFEYNALSPVFPGAVSSLNLLEASCLFREYLKFFQFKSSVKSASHYFCCYNGFTDDLLRSVTMVMCQISTWLDIVYMCCCSSLSTTHVGFFIMTLNFTTQGILNTIEYLLFQIQYFEKRHI